MLAKHYTIVAEASDGIEAIQLALKLKPNLVITDLSMPNINGTQVISEIKKRQPEIKILVLTVQKAEEYIYAALQAGADGYMLKDDTQDELNSAIQQILLGKAYLSASISKNVMNGYIKQNCNLDELQPSWTILTQREIQILKLIAESKKNKQIAEILSISVKTVEKHRSNLMRKLDLHDISGLTTYALQNGLAISNGMRRPS
jgi:DNA-binding NarL/FixJ family response regulator